MVLFLATTYAQCWFHTKKVQWLHSTGVVDKFVIIWCDVSSRFIVPKITKIG